MGRQTGFYAEDNDYRYLLNVMHDLGLMTLPEIIPTDSEPKSYQILDFRMPKDDRFFYLVPEDVPLVDVFYLELERDCSLSKLDDTVSPVFQLRPCYREGDKIYNGRIYLGLYREELYHERLLKEYKRIANRIRRWAKTDRFNFYVGPNTERMEKNKQIRLMHFDTELHTGSAR